MTHNRETLDEITERFGMPKPVETDLPARPMLAMQIDLGEQTRTTCCCSLHGSLHNPLDCCPEHKRARPGIPVPRMPYGVTGVQA